MKKDAKSKKDPKQNDKTSELNNLLINESNNQKNHLPIKDDCSSRNEMLLKDDKQIESNGQIRISKKSEVNIIEMKESKKYGSNKRKDFEDFLNECECPALKLGVQIAEREGNLYSGYFCLNCCENEICKACFYKCHQDCPKFLKLSPENLTEEEKEEAKNKKIKFVCACELYLKHKKKQKEEIITVEDVVRKNLLNDIDYYKKVMNLFTNIFISQKNSKADLDIDKYYAKKFLDIPLDSYFETFEKVFQDKKKNKYLINFTFFVFVYMKLNSIFGEIKKISLIDFSVNNFFYFKSFQSYVQKQIDFMENKNEVEKIKSFFSYDFYIKIQKQFERTDVLKKNLNKYVQCVQIYIYYIDFGISFILFDEKTLTEIIGNIHTIANELYQEYLKNGKVFSKVTSKLLHLQYKCIQSYNYLLCNTYVNKTENNEEVDLNNLAFTNTTFGHLAIISMIKLINLQGSKLESKSNNDNNKGISDTGKYIILLKNSFFLPNIKKSMNFSFSSIEQGSYINQFINFKRETHNWIKEELMQLILDDSTSQDNQINFQKHSYLNSTQIDELYEFITKIYLLVFEKDLSFIEVIDIEINKYKNKKIKLNEISNKREKEILSDMILSGIDYTICLILKEIFFLWFKVDTNENEKYSQKVMTIIKGCIHILKFEVSVEEGQHFFSIGRSMQIIENIVFFSRGYLEKEIYSNPINQPFIDIIYNFFYNLPRNIKRYPLFEIDRTKYLEYRSMEFIPIYRRLIKVDTIFRFEDKNKFKEYFYKHLKYFINLIKEIKANKNENNNILIQKQKILSNLFQIYIQEITLNVISQIEISKEDADILLNNYDIVPLKIKTLILEALFQREIKLFLNPLNEYKITDPGYNEHLKEIDILLVKICKECNLDNLSEIIGNKNISEKEKKEYLKHLLMTIKRVSNFFYASTRLSYNVFKTYLRLHAIFLESEKEGMFELLLPKKDKTNDLTEEDLKNYFFQEIEKNQFTSEHNSKPSICYTYQNIYEQIYKKLRKYDFIVNGKMRMNSLKEDYFYDSINASKNYSDLERYSFIFYLTQPKKVDIKSAKNDSEKKYFKMLNEVIDIINKKENYIFNKVFSESFEKEYSLKYKGEFNCAWELFQLLKYYQSDEPVSIIISILSNDNEFLKQLENYKLMKAKSNKEIIEKKINEGILDKKLYLEMPDEYYPILKCIKILKQKIIYYYATCIIISKTINGSFLYKKIYTKLISYIKLFQQLLDNYNTTFNYFIFKYDIDVTKGGDTITSEFLQNLCKNRSICNIAEKYREQYFAPPTEKPEFYCEENKGNFYVYESLNLNKGTIFELFIKLYEFINDTLSSRFEKKIGDDMNCPDDNLLVVYSALTDFLIESFSSFDEEIKKLVEDKISDLFSEYCPFEDGIMKSFKIQNRPIINIDVNFDVFAKTRLFDLVNAYLLSTNSTLFHKYEHSKRGYNDLKLLVGNYLNLALFYVDIFVNKVVLETFMKKVNKKIAIEEYRENLESMIKTSETEYLFNPNLNLFDDDIQIIELSEEFKKEISILKKDIFYNIFHMNGDKEKYQHYYNNEEYLLLTKIFIFIKILEIEYHNTAYLTNFRNDIKERISYIEIGNINTDFNFYDKKIIVFQHFDFYCTSIELNYKISTEIENNVIKGKFYDFSSTLDYIDSLVNDSNSNQNKPKDTNNESKEDKLINLINELRDQINELKEEMKTKEENITKHAYFTRKYRKENQDKMIYLFSDIANRKDHSSKIRSLIKFANNFGYNYLFNDSKSIFVFDNFVLLNRIHIFLIVIINVLLMVFFYKGTDSHNYDVNVLDEENNKELKGMIICSSIALFMEVCYLLLYYYNFFDLEVNKYYSIHSKYGLVLPKLIKENDDDIVYDETPEEYIRRKDVLDEILLTKHDENVKKKANSEYLDDIYSDIDPYYSIIIARTIYTNPEALIIFVSLIFNICFLSTRQYIFLVMPMICTIYFMTPVLNVFEGLKEKKMEILFTLIFNLILLYIFMWIGFLAFSELFSYETVDKNNNEFEEKEQFCSSSIQCLLVFWNSGLFNEGTEQLMNRVSYKHHAGLYIGIFFYNIVSFIIIHTVFANVFTGLTSDAFSSFREISDAEKEDKETKCYLCDLTASDAIVNGIDFEKHKKKHSISKYFEFLLYLFFKSKNDFNIQEKIIYEQIMRNEIFWVPYNNMNSE